MSKTLDALRNGKPLVPGAPVKRGFPGVPCPRCGDTDCITLLLHNVTQFQCSSCEETIEAADLELLIIAWVPVLDWIHLCPHDCPQYSSGPHVEAPASCC